MINHLLQVERFRPVVFVSVLRSSDLHTIHQMRSYSVMSKPPLLLAIYPHMLFLFFFLMIRRPPRSTFFPSPTLFRSGPLPASGSDSRRRRTPWRNRADRPPRRRRKSARYWDVAGRRSPPPPA